MSRLPTPGQDEGTWGTILNDYLAVEHNADGSLKRAGQPGGLATLDGTGQVPSAQLPSVMHTSGNETVTGAKDFTGGITVNGEPIVTDAMLDTALTEVPANSLLTAKGDFFVATAPGVVTRLGVGSDGQILQADSAQPAGLAWRSSAENTRVSGLAGDGATDDGPRIQSTLDAIGKTGNHSVEVMVEAPPNGVIYINSTVQVQSNNTILRFGSPLSFGPLGRIRIQGEAAETPATGKPFLTADSLEGSTTLTLNNVAPFSVGSYILLRGARDATGNPTREQKEYHSVASVAGNTLTLTEPLGDDFLAYNPNPDAPAGTSHESQVTRVISSLVSAPAVRGDRTVTVLDTSIFAAGDIVQVADDTHTTKPDGTIETSNYKHREIAEIKEIVSGTELRLSHALYHTYDMPALARVIKLQPVRNSRIQDASVTWSAMSLVGNAFEIKYGVQCALLNCSVSGDGAHTKSWKNQAFRLSDSYMCQTSQCYAANPAVTGSGNGYGATLYGATNCMVRDCRFSSLRHSVLLFNGAAGNTITGCVSEDCCISDYDLHGAECIDNLFSGCTAIGGDSAADDGSTNKSACKAGNTSHADGDFNNVFTDMLIVNYGGAAFEVVPSSANNGFRDSRVNGAQTGVKLVSISSNTGLLSTDNFVDNVDFADITGSLTNVNGSIAGTMVRGLVIANCRFTRAVTGLVIQNAQKVHLRRNEFYDPALPAGTYAITANNVSGFSAKGNDISGCVRGVKLTASPAARVYGNIMHDLTETNVFEDAGGNDNALFVRNEIYGFTPITSVSGTGPSTGGVTDIHPAYQPDVPARHGFVEWNYDPAMAGSGSGATGNVSGTLYLMKISSQTGGTVSNILATVGTAGSGLTAGQNFAALYDDAGNLLQRTNDQAANWAATGLMSMPLQSPVTLRAGRDYFVGLLANGTTVPLFVATGAGGGVTTPNSGLAASRRRFATNTTTGLTAMPASITLTNSGARTYWVALS
ncbi:right-handed parallel beta-helix repeat-containing protein [Candidatus Saccharibacteria bacterium]|nr:right-handed parallel beta-helix repeat-containing protein [Candidatus Saccharibacteria bacterium]